jgi:hypothetical protein
MNWFYQNIVNPERGEALAQVKRGHLAQLPIPLSISGESQNDDAHQQMEGLVDKMLSLHKRLPSVKAGHARTLIERQIAATDKEIDRLVYDLYGLTDDEIALVEGLS